MRHEVQTSPEVLQSNTTPSEAARTRLLSLPGEPLFIANWERALMIHYEVDRAALQRLVPFELDLRDGRAFVSLVAFRLVGMRTRFGGRFVSWLLRPIASHDFLNVRTYVRHRGETGIFFLAEWLSSRLSVALGPLFFGLPYRAARLEYDHPGAVQAADAPGELRVTGQVSDSRGNGIFAYSGFLDESGGLRHCARGSVAEWLMERYTAFTDRGGKRRFFRVWHTAWLQIPARVEVQERSLLQRRWSFFQDAAVAGANFSPGLEDVWMGWPHRADG
jgi:uncharacterized protein YqjF (DUF2071 family)